MGDITGGDPLDRSIADRTRYTTPPARPSYEVPRTDVVRGDAVARDERSIGDLLKDFTHDASNLIRQEVNLAKVEMSEKIAIFQRNIASIAIGAALLLVATLLVIAAINRGLTALFTAWFGWDVAVWLAPIVLALLFGLIGFGLIGSGKSSIRREGITPHQTVDTLHDDKRWVQSRMKQS
jgi:hypothetical protein